jgi:hypothetical protein
MQISYTWGQTSGISWHALSGMKELGQVKEEHQSAIETSFPSEHSGDLFISSSSPPFFK